MSQKKTSNTPIRISRALWYANEEVNKGPNKRNKKTIEKFTNHTCAAI